MDASTVGSLAAYGHTLQGEAAIIFALIGLALLWYVYRPDGW